LGKTVGGKERPIRGKKGRIPLIFSKGVLRGKRRKTAQKNRKQEFCRRVGSTGVKRRRELGSKEEKVWCGPGYEGQKKGPCKTGREKKRGGHNV